MATIVQKYGGSSVADVPRLRDIADAVVARHRAGDRVVVVVSAMGKTTDQLISQAQQISTDPPRRELDMLVTAGERISMALLSMAIHQLGAHAVSFTGSQSGIITDEQHQGARILEVRPQRLEAALDAGRIVIVAGYQGVSRQREVTTLGRGGSDTTAVALAAALQADACEIYSDVDGVYTADPRVCPQAQLLPQVPFSVMHSMAGAGAKVLNADAVEFARRAQITIHARKTGDTSGRETIVSGDTPPVAGVTAVVGAKHVSLVRGSIDDLSDAFWTQLAGMGARVMGTSPVSLLVDRVSIPGAAAEPLAQLVSQTAPGLSCESVGVVTLVGSSLFGTAAGLTRRLLREAGFACSGTFGGDTALVTVLPVAQVDDAVRLLHQHFIR